MRTPQELARMKRTLKKLPHLHKRGKMSLIDLFPNLNVGAIVFEKRERPSDFDGQAERVKLQSVKAHPEDTS